MKKYLIHIFILISCLFISNGFIAQNLHYELPDNANKMFDLGNFLKAKELYRELYKKDLTNVKYKYRFGVCLLYTYERDDAIKTLEQVSKSPSCPVEVWYHLARAYHLTNRYDNAIKYYKKYKLSNGSKPDLSELCDINIKMCNNAKIITKTPLNVTFENLGSAVNSKGKDFLPLITPDESLLSFTTRREGTTGRIYDMGGYYTSDIYGSKYKYGKWSKTRSIGYPNSYGNEETAGISENGETIFYYVNNPNSKNNLQMANFKRNSFGKSVELDDKIFNIRGQQSLSATISNDGSLLIFSSDRNGSKGGFDLFYSKKLPNGKWGEAKNLSDNINTSFDELYPYLIDDGETLYFSSNNDKSMGGFDIFKSTYNEENNTWSTPENIGYPINTPDDNFNICFTENKKFGYISAYRDDSYGDVDIYKVDFKSTEPLYTTIKGYILDKDSNIIKQHLHIEVFNKKTNDLQGNFEVNEKKGSFIMILPPNTYLLNIEIPSKGTFKKTFIVKGRKYYLKEVNQNIIVSFDEEPIKSKP